MSLPVKIVDLFCGAGGTSTGAVQACQALGLPVSITAINHWPVAIATHRANHPEAQHLCQSLDNLDPRKVSQPGLDVLCASPECTHHSRARGSAPCQDQSRASAWHVLRWAEALKPRNVLVENVPEFEKWGPLNKQGRPNRALVGATFQAFVYALKSLGYQVEWRILNAADFGDATSRKRLFVQASKQSIRWPVPTRREAISATEIIDWSLPVKLVSARKHWANSTKERMAAGRIRFGGNAFLLKYYSTGGPRSITEPLDTITTKDRFGLCVPTDQGLTFRMLQPKELSRAMGFPEHYQFSGNRGDQVKQIGNAVAVGTARALFTAILTQSHFPKI